MLEKYLRSNAFIQVLISRDCQIIRFRNSKITRYCLEQLFPASNTHRVELKGDAMDYYVLRDARKSVTSISVRYQEVEAMPVINRAL